MFLLHQTNINDRYTYRDRNSSCVSDIYIQYAEKSILSKREEIKPQFELAIFFTKE